MSRAARIRLATFVDASTRNEHCGNRKGSKSGKQLIRATRHVCWFEFANSTKDGHGDGADRHGYSNLQKKQATSLRIYPRGRPNFAWICMETMDRDELP